MKNNYFNKLSSLTIDWLSIIIKQNYCFGNNHHFKMIIFLKMTFSYVSYKESYTHFYY